MAKSKACTCRTQSLVCLSVCMVFGILFIYFALDMVDCNTDTKKIWEKGKNKKLDFQSSWHWSQPTLSLSLSLSLSLVFVIYLHSSKAHQGWSWYINTCLNPLALVLAHCVALVTLALSPFPFALHYSKASSLLTKLHIIYIYIFFFKSFALYYYHYYYYFPLKYQDDRNR